MTVESNCCACDWLEILTPDFQPTRSKRPIAPFTTAIWKPLYAKQKEVQFVTPFSSYLIHSYRTQALIKTAEWYFPSEDIFWPFSAFFSYRDGCAARKSRHPRVTDSELQSYTSSCCFLSFTDDHELFVLCVSPLLGGTPIQGWYKMENYQQE